MQRTTNFTKTKTVVASVLPDDAFMIWSSVRVIVLLLGQKLDGRVRFK